jgi:mannitol/fructose-specific phosphotransferase system IIA component (Ntr-type)
MNGSGRNLSFLGSNCRTHQSRLLFMTLAQLLKPERVLPDMQAIEHWPAILELVERLVANGDLPEEGREPLLVALRKREDQCSTGIGSGLAIPHVFSDHIDEVIAIFGRSKEGIDFCSLDSNPVNFVVLFVVPTEQYNTHLRTLAAIARTLNSGAIRNQLGEAADAKEILAVLEGRTAEV